MSDANTQLAIESLREQVRRGELTADQFNVEKIRVQRVHLVRGRIPAEVRRALNAAVKAGRLGHVKKDGHKPEAYFHPSFEYMVAGERNRVVRETLEAVAKVCI